MNRSILLAIVCSAGSALTACSGGSAPSTPVTANLRIKHVVVIFQENRTPDNLFHGLAGADIADSGINSRGETITLQPIALANDL